MLLSWCACFSFSKPDRDKREKRVSEHGIDLLPTMMKRSDELIFTGGT